MLYVIWPNPAAAVRLSWRQTTAAAYVKSKEATQSLGVMEGRRAAEVGQLDVNATDINW